MGVGAELHSRLGSKRYMHSRMEFDEAFAQAENIVLKMQLDLDFDAAVPGYIPREKTINKSKRRIIDRAWLHLKASELQAAGTFRLQACQVLEMAKTLVEDEKEKASLNERSQKAFSQGIYEIASSERLFRALNEYPGVPVLKDEETIKFLDRVDALRFCWAFGTRPSLASPATSGEPDDKIKWVAWTHKVHDGFRTGKHLSDKECKEIQEQCEKPPSIAVD